MRRGGMCIGGLALVLALAGCAVVERQVAGEQTERRLILGAPATTLEVRPGAQVETVRIRALGAHSSPSGMSLGYHDETAAYFPARCGAVFIDASPEAIEAIGRYMPDLGADCVQPKESLP